MYGFVLVRDQVSARPTRARATQAEPPRSSSRPASAQVKTLRFGSAEDAILRELRRTGGPVPRQLMVGVVYASSARSRPNVCSLDVRGEEGPAPAGPARQNAETTLSRALRSLERKRLIVRGFNRPTGQTLVWLANPPAPPSWEHDARAEEAFADRCDAVRAELAELGRRARTRAATLRVERSSISTTQERGRDVAPWARLMSLGSRRRELEAVTPPSPREQTIADIRGNLAIEIDSADRTRVGLTRGTANLAAAAST